VQGRMAVSPNREAIEDWSQKHKDKGQQQTGAQNADAENVAFPLQLDGGRISTESCPACRSRDDTVPVAGSARVAERQRARPTLCHPDSVPRGGLTSQKPRGNSLGCELILLLEDPA
jgi:hypothetical protein